jgi:osmotically-inducible protein OsmY
MNQMPIDTRLVQHVLEELADDPQVDLTNIRVQASSGTIILTGSVPSESQRLTVERDAWWVDTVRAVDNQLVVDRHATHAQIEQ